MRMIWTRSKQPFSRVIRGQLGQDCSHFALVFDAVAGGLMFESNLLGAHPKFLKTSLKHIEIVHSIDLPLSIEKEDAVWEDIVNRFDGQPYDWGAFFYFCWRVVLKKLFWRPIPKKNAWARDGENLCIELFEAVKKHTKLKDIEIDIPMISPHELYNLLEPGAKGQLA